MLIRSGALDVVVIDSVAALVPRAEIEGEMGDTHIGLQARLMSQALRKLTGNLNRSRTICIFINQLREKIGVMFGCLLVPTRVTLADGSQEKIGKIVNQRMPVEVLSYDPELGRGRAEEGRQLVRQRCHRRVPPVHGGEARRQRASASSPARPTTRSARRADGVRRRSSRSAIASCRQCRTTSPTSSGRSCSAA